MYCITYRDLSFYGAILHESFNHTIIQCSKHTISALARAHDMHWVWEEPMIISYFSVETG